MKKSYEAVKLSKVLYGEDMIRTSGETTTSNFSTPFDDESDFSSWQ